MNRFRQLHRLEESNHGLLKRLQIRALASYTILRESRPDSSTIVREPRTVNDS